MRFEENITAPVARSAAWAFLWDTQRLARCLPGCVAVDEIEPQRRYRAAFEDRVGPYGVHFDIEVTVVEARPEDAIRLKAFGEDKRLGASQTMDMLLTLESPDADHTDLKVVAEVQMHGKIATLGQFVVKRKAKQVIGDFARNINTELSRSPARGNG